MRDRFGARNPRSWALRCHAQTSGVSLTAQQPQINVVRTALQALAAVMGGTQSLHTNAFDEAYALPTTEAATLALRTQQVIAYETGVSDVVDPLGGSYYVERLTGDLERETLASFEVIDGMGGMIEAIEKGYPQREIAESAYRFQQAVERGDQIVVGVNRFGLDSGEHIDTLYIDESAAERQVAKVIALRRRRDQGAVNRALDRLHAGARGTANLMPVLLDAVRAYATVGEMCDVLRQEWGEYEETAVV